MRLRKSQDRLTDLVFLIKQDLIYPVSVLIKISSEKSLQR